MDPTELLTGLARPGAFPRAGPTVEVRQTHISMVFLTGDRVYKVKKPVALWGFLDYSTPERRRALCEEEVRLNRRLAPDVYLGVEPVVVRDGRPAVGGPGEVVDWCVVMRRLADEATLAHRVHAGLADASEADAVGRYVAAFHDRAAVGATGPAVVPVAFARVLRQNFLATRAAVPAVFPAALHAWLDRRMAWLLRRHRRTLARRLREGRAVDGHGDLRAEHLVRAAGPGATSWIAIDALEYAPAMRRIDPLSDVAFLAMDLASLGRRDLGDALLRAYVGARGDPDAGALLPLFLAFRAHVRAKVDAHRAREPEIPPPDRASALVGARHHLALAWSWARTGLVPPLVLLAGAAGTGKSHAARRVAPWLGADVYASDVERKRLAGLAPTARVEGPALAALYSREMSIRTYDAIGGLAVRALAAGRPAVLDATFLLRAARARAVAAARAVGAPTVVVELTVPDDVARARLLARARAGGDPSDATVEVRRAQLAESEPVGDAEADVVLRADASGEPDAFLLPMLDALVRHRSQARWA